MFHFHSNKSSKLNWWEGNISIIKKWTTWFFDITIWQVFPTFNPKDSKWKDVLQPRKPLPEDFSPIFHPFKGLIKNHKIINSLFFRRNFWAFCRGWVVFFSFQSFSNLRNRPPLSEPLEPFKGVINKDPILALRPDLTRGRNLQIHIRKVIEIWSIIDRFDLDGYSRRPLPDMLPIDGHGLTEKS